MGSSGEDSDVSFRFWELDESSMGGWIAVVVGVGITGSSMVASESTESARCMSRMRCGDLIGASGGPVSWASWRGCLVSMGPVTSTSISSSVSASSIPASSFIGADF